ncbi:Ig-like domain-containing protein [Compostibacter hankyongensis]|uniref:BIG2 domain-containing protein n=1 Tax=Compostibacter hankyongensis TaxID=1007089 RepID=A0ABP8FMS2_9BACT
MKQLTLKLLLVIGGITLMNIGCKKDDKVDNSIKGITLAKSTATLKVGESTTLTYTIFPENAANKNVTWSTSDETVATVDNKGVVTAVKPGSAVITVTTEDGGEKATCSATVTRSDAVNVSGNVDGTWAKYSVINVTGHIKVPAGKTLTIEEGVEVNVSTGGQDANNTKIEWIVDGSLYIKGTPANPVLISVPAAERTTANTFKRLWGGIIGSTTCPEMLIDNAIIEYTGAITTATSPSVTAGLFKAGGGEGMVAFNTNNPKGKYVIQHTTFRSTGEDAIYVQGGSCIFTNNTFYAVGEAGGEAINVKAGCKVDAAYNLMYSANTNAFKLSNSGSSPTRAEAQINAYNNTIVATGWRRDPNGPKGGSIWAEKGALVNVYNNLVINAMFRAKAPKWQQNATDGPDLNSKIDYNYYAAGPQTSNIPQHIANGTASGYDGFKPGVKDAVYGAHDISGTGPGDKDPMFVSFPFVTNGLLDFTFDTAWDFHLKAGSPALTGAKTDITPYFSSTGVTVNGTTYKSPAASAFFGAFGAN